MMQSEVNLDTIDDFEIVSSIDKEGFSFFDKCYSQSSGKNLTKIVQYYIMYLDGELFGKSLQLLVDYICNNNSTDIWQNYLPLCSNNKAYNPKIKKYISTIVTIVADYDFKKQYMVYDKIILNKHNTLTLSSYFDRLSKKFFANLFKCDNLDVNKTAVLIKKVMKNIKVKRRFINYVAKIYNDNVPNLITDTQTLTITTSNIFKTLLELWKDGNTIGKMKEIEFDYITSKVCPIKWYSRDNTKQTYTFSTSLSFLILCMIRLLYIPALKKLAQLPTYIEQANTSLDRYSNSVMANLLTTRLLNLTTQYENYIKFLEADIKQTVKDFCSNFVYVISNTFDNQITLDDIVSVLCDYYLNNTSHIDDKNVTELALKVMNSKKYCKNIDIRLNFLAVYTSNKYQHSTEFVTALVNLHNDMDSSTSRGKKYFVVKKKLFQIMSVETPDMIAVALTADIYIGHIFVTMLIKDLSDLNEIIHDLLADADYKNSFELQQLVGDISSFSIATVNFIMKLTTNIKSVMSILTKDDVIIRLATVINSYTDLCVTKIELKDKKILDCVFNMIMLCMSACRVSPKLIDEIVSSDMYNYHNFEAIIDKRQLNTGDFKYFLDKLKVAKEAVNKSELVIPDEFLDPLTFKLIQDPILLPSMVTVSDDLFLDRVTISLQLTSKEENPFTREKLTMKQIDEFNKRPEVECKLKKFKEKIDSWKKENML